MNDSLQEFKDALASAEDEAIGLVQKFASLVEDKARAELAVFDAARSINRLKARIAEMEKVEAQP